MRKPRMRIRQNGDLISGGLLAGLGIFVVTEARRWDYLGPDGPGPGFFPMWYGLALIGLSIALMIQSLTRGAAERGAAADWWEVGRALLGWAALALSIVLLKVLGFLLSFALLTAFIVSFMYRRPLVHGLAAGVLSSGAFYAIFPLSLNVALPVGVLGF
jgi:putative tricarboxylic transport membrane protein